MNAIIDGIIQDIEKAALESAGQVADAMKPVAIEDGKAFLTSAVPRLKRWFQLYLDKSIDEEEFKRLLGGLKDYALMKGLTLAGMTQVQIDKAKNALLSVVGTIATNALGKLI